jgi:hypothetical protein
MKSAINFTDPVAKAKFCNQARQLDGVWTVEFKRYRAGRTLKQNNAYHALIVPIFADWLTAEWGCEHTHDEAHMEIRKTILGREIIHPETGLSKMICSSTTKLNGNDLLDSPSP